MKIQGTDVFGDTMKCHLVWNIMEVYSNDIYEGHLESS